MIFVPQGICDGAASVVLASEEAVKANGFKPLARLVAYATVGVPPEIMGIGPVPAIENVLKAAGLTLNDIDLFEVCEARDRCAIRVARMLRSPNHTDN